jgi:hypothetical protein
MRMNMRTTINIEDDMLEAAKDLARWQKLSAGKVISSLLRFALSQGTSTPESAPSVIGGFKPFFS